MDKQCGHNCLTCTLCGVGNDESMHCHAEGVMEVDEQIRFDTEPQHMHPCSQGEAMVATAIAGVEFFGKDLARHFCGKEQTIAMWTKRNGKWKAYTLAHRATKFCTECGKALPAADQLPAMYEAWKQEGYINCFSSQDVSFVLDGKEYLLELKEVKNDESNGR